jgi:hypothetical protein
MAHTIDFTTEGAELCFTGFVTGQELFDAKAKFFNHGFEPAAAYVLCDFSEGEKFDIPTSDVDRMVEQDRSELARHPKLLEVVIAPQNLVYGLARMWQAKVNSVRPHTAVVRNRDEAVEWLQAAGIKPSPNHCTTPAARRAAAATGGAKERV